MSKVYPHASHLLKNGVPARIPPRKRSTRVKEGKLAESKAMGHLRGVANFENTKKGTMQTLKKKLLGVIDRIDPIEIAATIAGTVLIHSALRQSEEIWNKISAVALGTPLGAASFISENWMPAFQAVITQNPELAKQIIGKSNPLTFFKMNTPDVYLWLLSFFMAVMLIKQGGNILGMMEKGVVALAGLLIA